MLSAFTFVKSAHNFCTCRRPALVNGKKALLLLIIIKSIKNKQKRGNQKVRFCWEVWPAANAIVFIVQTCELCTTPQTSESKSDYASQNRVINAFNLFSLFVHRANNAKPLGSPRSYAMLQIQLYTFNPPEKVHLIPRDVKRLNILANKVKRLNTAFFPKKAGIIGPNVKPLNAFFD